MFNFALIGCGAMAHWHAQQLQKIRQVNVIAVVDPLADHARKFKDQYFHAAAEYHSFEQLLASPPAQLDAVVLVTPHAVHYPHAKAALEHGIHVLLDKPMVTNSIQAYDLWRTVKKTGKLLGITYQAPYTREFQYLAGQRDADQLGKIQLISGWLSQSWLRFTQNTWRQDPAQSGGGQMYDSGAHLLNAIMWLMNDPVVEVACFYNTCHSPVDINGVVIARFANGAIASIAIGGNCPAFRTEIQIQSDSLFILTDQYGGKLEITGSDGNRIHPNPELHPHGEGHSDARRGGAPHENFVNAMLGEEPVQVPVRYGVLLSAMMDAMYQSAADGKVVKISPVPANI